ncbi:OprD family outer membrane porin [Sulfurimonas sp. MAG313]|nr:OprD family outer membrane porin [Sulfurimonas sp. MAG313]MDF1880084.1 OprD family outer membrane porin [Sulfurimonas sp. MAG313]
MTKINLLLLVLFSSIHAADSFDTWFTEGKVKGNVKYYYIATNKDKVSGSKTSAHANTLGGKLSYTTEKLYGLSTGATFMTSNGFALPSSVDASIIGRDNGVRLEGDPSGKIAQQSFAVLGEAFMKYQYEDLSVLYGRQVINTPLIHGKVVRLLPSAVQGAFVDYQMDKVNIATSYLTHFKQRTSNKFINIIEHALGNNAKAITGSDQGEVVTADLVYKSKKTTFRVYDYYAKDFINSMYLDVDVKNTLASGWKVNAAYQYIYQSSIGNADTNLDKDGSLTNGNKISSNAMAFKFNASYKEMSLGFALSKVLSNSDRHDSLVLPWDGTPLYTNMITSNDLFQSNYGKAINADSIYIGGTTGIRLGYTQKYDFTGFKGFKTSLSYLNAQNSKFAHNQRDYNIVLGYSIGEFSLALKGIWVRYNTSQSVDGTINPQDNKLTQYRVIANYKF